MATDIATAKSQLRGIVEFKTPEDAARAIAKAHESLLDGSKIACRYDQKPTKKVRTLARSDKPVPHHDRDDDLQDLMHNKPKGTTRGEFEKKERSGKLRTPGGRNDQPVRSPTKSPPRTNDRGGGRDESNRPHRGQPGNQRPD